MWAFASRRLRTYLLFAVGAPLAGWALTKIGEEIESRTGETKATRAIHKTRGLIKQVERKGPFSRRI